MFPTNIVSGIVQGDATYKLLKPWWDVMTDYLAVAMLMISFVAGTSQITKGGIICVPAVDCQSGNNYMNTAAKNICSMYEANYTGIKPVRTLTLADRRQYEFVDAECGVKAVHFFQSYFPFIIFLEVLFLIIINNLWLKLPETASVVESFIELVLECNNAQGTLHHLTNAIGKLQPKDALSEATWRSMPRTRPYDYYYNPSSVHTILRRSSIRIRSEDNVGLSKGMGIPQQGTTKESIGVGDEKTPLLLDNSSLPDDNQTTSSKDANEDPDRSLEAIQAAQIQEDASAEHTHRVPLEAEVHINIRQDEDQSTTEADTFDLNRSLQVNQRITCLNCI